MFLKYRIMKEINSVEFPNATTFDSIVRNLKVDNEKALVAVDILGCKGYISCDLSEYPIIKLSLEHLSSFVRYKHDMKICAFEWALKIGSFAAIITSLLFTEELQSALLKVPELICKILSLL